MPTRPALSWSDLAGASAGVFGLGVEGAANVAKLRSLGVTPVLVDEHPRSAEYDGLEVLPLADGGLEALARCDVVVKSPGVSRYRREVTGLVEAGIPVVGGVGLWLHETDRSKVVCVTGTKGKSTTTAIAGHLVKGLGYEVLVAGNIGRPPWGQQSPGPEPDYVIVEISSYQATDLALSPPVVAVTSLHSDHLDWHGDIEHYHRDKLSACSQPGAEVTVADGASPMLRARAELLGPQVTWVVDDGARHRWIEHLGLPGAHNRRNALIAAASIAALGVPGADDEGLLADAAGGFEGLESRLHKIGTVAGVDFVDDSLSTNVLPTVAALEALPERRIALIVGGHDRGIEYEPLAAAIGARTSPMLALTLPANGPRIRTALEGAGVTDVVDCTDLEVAVRRGFDWARPDGVVLLSPAAPSFGQFRDYKERAAAFRSAMISCRQMLEGGAPRD